jgi:glycosyltransferase involved in cell wall biosynthesis
MDDGSTDGAVEALPRSLASVCRVVRQENAGKSVAMNRALREVSGTYYCILDADDEMDPDRLTKQVAVLEANPDVAAAFCGHELLIGGKRIAPKSRSKDRWSCAEDIEKFRMPAHDPTAMYRVSLVRDIEYEPSLRIAQGYDYVLRVGERSPMLVIGETLYSYRVHPESITRADQARRRHAANEVRRRACERRGLYFETRGPGADLRLHGRDRRVSCDCIESVVDLCSQGRRGLAVRTGVACARFRPADPHYYRALVYSLIPSAFRRWLRPSEQRCRRAADEARLEAAR